MRCEIVNYNILCCRAPLVWRPVSSGLSSERRTGGDIHKEKKSKLSVVLNCKLSSMGFYYRANSKSSEIAQYISQILQA